MKTLLLTGLTATLFTYTISPLKASETNIPLNDRGFTDCLENYVYYGNFEMLQELNKEEYANFVFERAIIHCGDKV